MSVELPINYFCGMQILLKECDAASMNEKHSVLSTRPIVMQNIALVKCVGPMHRPEMVFNLDK